MFDDRMHGVNLNFITKMPANCWNLLCWILYWLDFDKTLLYEFKDNKTTRNMKFWKKSIALIGPRMHGYGP